MNVDHNRIRLTATFFALLWAIGVYTQIPGNTIGNPCVNELLIEDFSSTIPDGWEGDFMLLNPPLVEGWILESGPTMTANTGPDAAFNGDFYLYLETNGPAPLDAAYSVNTPPIPLSDVNASIRFRVLMHGDETGSLRVNILYGPGFTSSENVIDIIGEQHTSGTSSNWEEAWVDIRQYSGQTIKVQFEGMKGSGELGDIAIDLVQVCSEPRVPTMGEWSLIILSLLFLIFGVIYIRRPQTIPSRVVSN